MLGVNLRAPMLIAVAAARLLADGGAIVNITDASVATPWPDYVPYQVSMAGLAAFTRSLARADWPEAPSRDLRRMMKRVQSMLHHALDSLVRLDPQAARAVCREDDDVDRLLKDVFDALAEAMAKAPDRIPEYISTLTVARCLERIADLATNIAEDVVFTVEGEVIRHGGGEDDSNVVPMPQNRSGS